MTRSNVGLVRVAWVAFAAAVALGVSREIALRQAAALETPLSSSLSMRPILWFSFLCVAVVALAIASAPVGRARLALLVGAPIAGAAYLSALREWMWLAVLVGSAVAFAWETLRPGASSPAARSSPRVILAGAIVALAMFVCADLRRTVEPEPSIGAGAPATTEWSSASAIVLDASNALEVPGAWRDFELTANVRMLGTSTLEIRMRAPRVGEAVGIALLMGSDPRLTTTFARETRADLRPIGGREDPVREGLSHTIAVRASGERYSLAVDGKPLIGARDRQFESGTITLLAATGSVEMRDVRVSPLPAAAPEMRADVARIAFLAMVVLIALCGFAASRLLPVEGIECAGSTVAAALVLSLAFVAERFDASPGPRVALLALAAGFSLAPLLRARPFDAAATVVVLPLALLVAGIAAIPADLFGRARDSAVLALDRWSWPTLDDDIAWLEHPFLRFGNGWLARHSFADMHRSSVADGEARPAILVCGAVGDAASALEAGGRVVAVTGVDAAAVPRWLPSALPKRGGPHVLWIDFPKPGAPARPGAGAIERDAYVELALSRYAEAAVRRSPCAALSSHRPPSRADVESAGAAALDRRFAALAEAVAGAGGRFLRVPDAAAARTAIDSLLAEQQK